MIDKKLVQDLIESEIGYDFEIGSYHDAGPYIIIFWKHKLFSSDDERGNFIGSGPVIYFKEENEYRAIGSGDWLYGDYANYLDPDLDKDKRDRHEFVMELFEGEEKDEDAITNMIDEIKKEILKRNYINVDDIDCLAILFDARRIFNSFDMKFNRDYSSRRHCMVVMNNKVAYEKFISFWKQIGFEYKCISETELVLIQEPG